MLEIGEINIKGFQSIWSKPFLEANNTEKFWMQDYELLTMILSAIMWQKNNGDMVLMADEKAKKYIEEQGLSHIWKLGVEELLVDEKVCGKVFWAAGKIYAMKQVKAPFVMVDLDLIIWKNIQELISSRDICCIHREELNPNIYPDKDFFNMQKNYEFCSDFDWSAMPVNTCMLYLADEEFKNYYVDKSIEFMDNCIEQEDNLCHMVFAEQRLLAMCAKIKEKKISSFFPEAFDIDQQDIFTHLWGFKNVLKFNYKDREAFNLKMVTRILKECPEELETIKNLKINGIKKDFFDGYDKNLID